MAKSIRRNWLRQAELIKAIAHPERLAILNLLCMTREDALTVKTIYEKLGLQQPVASRHLNILKNAGVVNRMRQGQYVCYCVCNEKMGVKALLGCFM